MDSILNPIWISLKTAITATIITFIIGILIAWWIANYQGKAKGLIDGILTAPLVLPPTVVGFLLLLALGKNGLIGRLLDLMGIRVIFTWYATVIAAVVVSFPLMYKTALGAFQQANQGNLIACARTLGASEMTIFWRIILPLAKPGLIAGILLTFARALGEFGATLILAGSIPGETQTIPIAIFFAAESGAMDRALWLVISLLTISVGVILAVNYRQLSNTNLLANLKKKSAQTNHKNRGYSQRNITGKKQQQLYLEVNIQKQLPEFLLDIEFSINQEQTPLGILGASGAGKSTLLRCIAGLETPDRGIIVLNGRILFDSTQGINLKPQERAVGLLFQDYALFPHLSVAANIAFGMSAKKLPSIVKQEVNQQLRQIDLPEMSNAMTPQLSGGEQQRVALARVLASYPDLTLLDEPFSALDTNLKRRLLKLLQTRINHYDGLTMYVTHDLEQAYQLCPQLLMIERGRLIAFNSREDIVHHPPNLRAAQLADYKNFSLGNKISSQTIQAQDWQCNLQCDRLIPDQLSHIAIHAKEIVMVESNVGINVFKVWLAHHVEFPSQVILYLKLHSSAQNAEDYHLAVEVNHHQWHKLVGQTFPWYIQLPSSKIVLLEKARSLI